MTDMHGGNTPIVPDETIEEWKRQGLLSETPTLPEMTDEQIVKLALKHLFPYDESGELQWWGKEEQLLKFAKEMYNKGYSDCKSNQSSSNEVFSMKMGESLVKN